MGCLLEMNNSIKTFFLSISIALLLSGCVNSVSEENGTQKIDYNASSDLGNETKVFGVCDENGCRELEEGETLSDASSTLQNGTSVGEIFSLENNSLASLEPSGSDADQESLEKIINTNKQDTIIWFWSPYCPLCLREVDNIKEFVAQPNNKINVIGIGFSGRVGDERIIRDFVSTNSLGKQTNIPQFYDAKGGEWKRFGFVSTPSYLFVNKNGVIVGKSNGVLGLKGLINKSTELFNE
jgi:thiol-disulfide isomerase/thioredoxin